MQAATCCIARVGNGIGRRGLGLLAELPASGSEGMDGGAQDRLRRWDRLRRMGEGSTALEDAELDKGVLAQKCHISPSRGDENGGDVKSCRRWCCRH